MKKFQQLANVSTPFLPKREKSAILSCLSLSCYQLKTDPKRESLRQVFEAQIIFWLIERLFLLIVLGNAQQVVSIFTHFLPERGKYPTSDIFLAFYHYLTLSLETL
jgi:hypothetical protein